MFTIFKDVVRFFSPVAYGPTIFSTYIHSVHTYVPSHLRTSSHLPTGPSIGGTRCQMGRNIYTSFSTVASTFHAVRTVLPRNQGPVLKSENTLFWLLVVLQFYSYLRTCASYGMHFVRICQSQHKVSVCSRKSCTTVILFHFYQSAVSFFWFIFTHMC